MAITDNLEKMLASGRDDAMLRFGLGSAYFNAGQFDQAVPHLEQCLVHDETYSAAYKLLGKAYFKLKDTQNAQRIFTKGMPVAEQEGDKQSLKEMQVFLNKCS